jgi:hypothetical protein
VKGLRLPRRKRGATADGGKEQRRIEIDLGVMLCLPGAWHSFPPGDEAKVAAER